MFLMQKSTILLKFMQRGNYLNGKSVKYFK